MDFIKAVVVVSEDLGKPACIDKKEFRELSSNLKQIRLSFGVYLDYYLDSVRHVKNLENVFIWKRRRLSLGTRD